MSPVDAARAEVLRLTNAERARAGCGPVVPDARLERAAQDHTDWQAAHRTMSHTGAGGSTVGTRVSAAGYDWRRVGENVAKGYATGPAVMAAWVASPGHRKNMVDCAYTGIGVGFASGAEGPYWTQVFAAA